MGWRRYSPRIRASTEGRNDQAPIAIDSGSGSACASTRVGVEVRASSADADASKRSEGDRIISLVVELQEERRLSRRIGRIGASRRRGQDRSGLEVVVAFGLVPSGIRRGF